MPGPASLRLEFDLLNRSDLLFSLSRVQLASYSLSNAPEAVERERKHYRMPHGASWVRPCKLASSTFGRLAQLAARARAEPLAQDLLLDEESAKCKRGSSEMARQGVRKRGSQARDILKRDEARREGYRECRKGQDRLKSAQRRAAR